MTATLKYDIPGGLAPSTLKPNSAHTIILNEIPQTSIVLDIGRATGYLGRYLLDYKDCVVDGFEIDEVAAWQASQFYRQVYVGSADDVEKLEQVTGEYDILLLAAVLEHLAHPEITLQYLRQRLKPAGRAIISLPNVAHFSVRWNLLRGRFEYEDYGIMDKTHLHFYTLKTARELLENCGFRVEQVRWSHLGVGKLNTLLRWLPRGRYRIRQWLVTHFPELFGFEFIFVGRKIDV